jgi:DNA-directed RNA polymerase specialized sigma24 family protein
MSGMQEEFIRGVRELHKATRPHVNYVKDFERRAKNDPKGCAEEAQREIMNGTTMLQCAFREAFGMNFEQAFKDTFYLTLDQQHAIRETAPLPDHPVAREFFLLWLYWLHFHRLTLGFIVRCLQAPNESHEERAQAICACFIRHQLASWCAYLVVADDIAKQFPEQSVQQTLVEQFTAYFVVHTSLHTNKRLGKVIDKLREQNETRFERLIKEVSGEVLAVWQEKRAAWKGEYFQQADLMEMRNEVVRRLEKRESKPPLEVELATFADHEKLLKQAKAAGLPPREYELFNLRVVENPGMSLREAAQRMGIAEGTAKSLWSRIKKTLLAA